jgi:glyoxylase-like metal-dependent hydrolase (beta-lactamase superfamily II)
MKTNPICGSVYMIDAPFHGQSGVLGTYVVKGGSSIIIDPGPTVSIPYVVKGLERLNIERASLKYIALTHVHLDHASGSWKLLEECSSARLYVHPRGSEHMVDPERLEAAARGLFGEAIDKYGDVRGVSPEKIVESGDGEKLDLDGAIVSVLWTPGHSTHHQSFYVPEDEVAIVGDAGGFFNLGTGVIMPTTPPPFNPPAAIESLDRLIALKPRYICYGHFGFAENAVEKLEAHKKQIITWSRIVEEGLKEGMGLEEIYERIRAEDRMAEMAGKLSEKMQERSSLINLLGFIKYYEWIKK